MEIPLEVNKVYLFDIKHGLTMTFCIFFQKVKITPYLCMDSCTLNQEGPWTKEKLKLWSPNFQKSLPKSCLKSLENFVGVVWLIWMPHPLFKNRSDRFGTPCMYKECYFDQVWSRQKLSLFHWWSDNKH